MIVPLQVKEVMMIVGGLFLQMVVLALFMVKLLLDGGVISRSPHGRIDVMFGPVVTTEAHLAFSGARIHSNNTAEMTAMIEALSFLGPHGPAAQDGQSCIYYDSMHAAGMCLGTIQPLGSYALCRGLIVFFINLPMAEARDFHCSSHVVENLGKKTIPSDHAAVRLVIQKPTNRGHQSKRIPSWISKHPIFCSILQQLHDDHRFSPDPFCALAEF